MNLISKGMKRFCSLALVLVLLASCLVTGAGASGSNPVVYDSIYAFIAEKCYDNSGVESEILKSGALMDSYQYEIAEPDGTLLSFVDGRLVAKRVPVYGRDGRVSAIWEPKTYTISGKEGSLREDPDNYEVAVSESLEVTGAFQVKVHYEMDTNISSDLLNLPAVLAEEAASQMTVLNHLTSEEKPYMDYMEQLPKGQLKTMYDALDPSYTFLNLLSDSDKNVAVKHSFREVIQKMMDNCYESNGTLRIYSLLRLYRMRGLIYYYQNSTRFQTEIALFSQYLDELLAAEVRDGVELTVEDKETAIETLLTIAKQYNMIDAGVNIDFLDLRDNVQTARSMLLPPNEIIDISDKTKLGILVSALENKAVKEGEAVGEEGVVQWESTVADYGNSLILTCTRTADLCAHAYTDDNDSDCNLCGAQREVSGNNGSGSGDTGDSNTGDDIGGSAGENSGSNIGGGNSGSIVVGDHNDSALHVGSAGDFEKTLADAGEGESIRIASSIIMTEDIKVDTAVKITGTSQLNSAGHVLILTDAKASITADGPLSVASGIDGYVPVKEGDAHTYTLAEVQHPETGGKTAGSKTETVDQTRYLFLDLDPVNGMTLDALYASTSFAQLTDYNVQFSIEGNTGSGLVKTADLLVVKAFNADGRCVAQITYVVVVLGDTNCNGKVNTSDAAVTKNISMGKEYSIEIRMAADVNFSGTTEEPKVNSSDVSYAMAKWFAWDLNQYVSNLK